MSGKQKKILWISIGVLALLVPLIYFLIPKTEEKVPEPEKHSFLEVDSAFADSLEATWSEEELFAQRIRLDVELRDTTVLVELIQACKTYKPGVVYFKASTPSLVVAFRKYLDTTQCGQIAIALDPFSSFVKKDLKLALLSNRDEQVWENWRLWTRKYSRLVAPELWITGDGFKKYKIDSFMVSLSRSVGDSLPILSDIRNTEAFNQDILPIRYNLSGDQLNYSLTINENAGTHLDRDSSDFIPVTMDDLPQLIQRFKKTNAKSKEWKTQSRRILMAKTWMKRSWDFSYPDTLDSVKLNLEILDVQKESIERQLIRNGVVLVKDDEGKFPFVNDEERYEKRYTTNWKPRGKRTIYCVVDSISRKWKTDLLNDFRVSKHDGQKQISNDIEIRYISKQPKKGDVFWGLKKNPNRVIVLAGEEKKWWKEILDKSECVVWLADWNVKQWNSLLKAIDGTVSVSGVLPFYTVESLNKEIAQVQLGRSRPIDVGMHPDTLSRIKYMVNAAMSGRAFPGCQVLVVKDGNIIVDQNYGRAAYAGSEMITSDHMYDIASVTKVASTTLGAMKLLEWNYYTLNEQLQKKIPDTVKKFLGRPSTLSDISYQELLIHKTGLPAGAKIHRFLMNKRNGLGYLGQYFCDVKDSLFDVDVAHNMYMDHDYQDSLWMDLNKTWRDPSKKYKYSDVNMNILYLMFNSMLDQNYKAFKNIKDTTWRKPWEFYLQKEFYEPLGMMHTQFLPRRYHPQNMLVPTEEDKFWRGQLLQGYVHDSNAALMGGVAGNAGLFTTTNDLARLFQMMLQGGVYRGIRYLKPETIAQFTSAQPGTNRGLGFNKPSRNGTTFGVAEAASMNTYGHTGFTGTCVWVDPDEDMIFIFLCNRVHPKVNKRIYGYGIRKNIHRKLYGARLF